MENIDIILKQNKCKSKKCKPDRICYPKTGRCNKKKSYKMYKFAKNLYQHGDTKVAEKYGKIYGKKWEKYKLQNSHRINIDLPLEFSRKEGIW